MTRIVGIYREPECSPGRHRSNDTRLLERVADALRGRAMDVDLMSIEEASNEALEDQAAVVLSMCQARQSLERLARLEARGARVVNRPRAARNTYRDRLPAILRSAGVRFPATTLVETDGRNPRPIAVDGGIWLKRGDMHASESADVQWIESTDDLLRALGAFRARGIARAALQLHTVGEEVKFYGLADGSFFHWFHSGRNGRADPDADRLRRLVERSARAAGLDIFGGDVIVEPSGELTLIDLNDWPSFAPCRDEAADAIADYVARRVDVVWNRALVSSANESAV